jgi:TRAP-type C4-dicarboxylate transport system substrate-binding protein
MPDRIGLEIAMAVGMAPVAMPWSDTLPALASGVVTGVATTAVSGVNGKFWEMVKFFHATSHSWMSQLVTINNDAWKKIAPANQKIMADTARRLEPEFWAGSVRADKERKRTAQMIAGYMDRVPEAAPPLKAYLAEMKRG